MVIKKTPPDCGHSTSVYNRWVYDMGVKFYEPLIDRHLFWMHTWQVSI